jgi:hypothetical protein
VNRAEDARKNLQNHLWHFGFFIERTQRSDPKAQSNSTSSPSKVSKLHIFVRKEAFVSCLTTAISCCFAQENAFPRSDCSRDQRRKLQQSCSGMTGERLDVPSIRPSGTSECLNVTLGIA